MRTTARPPRRGPGAATVAMALLAALAGAATLASLPAAAQDDPPTQTVLVYGGDARFPPYEFLDEKGEPAGLNVELIRAVAAARGWTVRVELRAWPEVRSGLQRGAVDVAAMYRSAQRAQEVDFAVPHELVYHELYVRRGGPALRGLGDLDGLTVLVEADTYSAEALKALGLDLTLRTLPSEPDALESLARGEGDAAVVTQAVGRPFVDRRALGQAIAPSGPPVLLTEYAFVTRRGRPLLVEALNEGIASLKASGEYERIYQRWIRPDRSAERLRLAAALAAAAAAGLLAVAIWNRTLRRRVQAQTEALRREFEAREDAQRALAQSEEARRQSQKMEAIGRLAGGVAHDFNNILGVIMSYATFVRDQLVGLRADTADAEEILAASERAARLTRQLLAFSRSTPMATQLVDLGATVTGMATMLQRLLGEQIALTTAAPPKAMLVETDPGQLEQVLLNLAANARDAMPQGGQLRVVVAAERLADGNPRGLPAGDYAVLSVADTGVGMDEATRSRIFEPFFTTKEIGRGTGLGLAIVFANVEKMGGRVEVRSEPGQGSTFEIRLPRRSAVSPIAGDPEPQALLPGTGEFVLLAEDDEPLRRAARLALERAGHRVLEAKDGEEGLALARAALGLSMVVSDMVMPRMGGRQLVAALRERSPDLLALFVSGYVQDGAEPDLTAPGTAFLVKPYTPAGLVEAVARLRAEARRHGRGVA